MLEHFQTIKNEVESEITVKKSEFIANIFSVKSEEECKDKLNEIKKKYKDARHHVFAYRLSSGLERYSDDGEPAGTAGVPILDILRGNQLYNVLVVVTRYFGGILLGTGGLVKAYSDATKLAIEKLEMREEHLAVEYELKVSYNEYNIIQHYCSVNHIKMKDSSFSDQVVIRIVFKQENEEKFTKELNEILERKINMKKQKDNFYI